MMQLSNIRLLKIISAAVPSVIFIALASRQLFDPSVGYPDADRTLMDGVFIADFLRDLPLFNPVEYTLTYYAQYPALSIGYHPPFFPFIESLFILIFGEHIWSGRLALIALGLAGGACFFLMLSRMYSRMLAVLGTGLLASLPFIISNSWYTLMDIPALSMMLISAYLVWRYAEGDGDRYIYLAAICFPLSIWTKQTTVFMLLWLIPYLLIQPDRYRIFLSKASIGATIIAVLLTLPIAVITIYFADMNIGQSIGVNPRGEQISRLALQNLLSYPVMLYKSQLPLPVLVMSIFGFCISIFRRDRHTLFFALLIAATYVFFTLLNDPHVARYTIFWIPAFCVFAVTPMTHLTNKPLKLAYLLVIAITISFNITASLNKIPQYASGYSEAAAYIAKHNKTKTVLVDAWNNGYFTFFVRKFDPKRNLFVLRGDKLFTSSAIESKTWLTIHARNKQDIKHILFKYNVGLIVVEENDYTGIVIHKTFRKLLNSSDFVLRSTIPIKSNLTRLSGQTLKIYEYIGPHDKQSNDLRMDLPVIGKSILIPADNKQPRLSPLIKEADK